MIIHKSATSLTIFSENGKTILGREDTTLQRGDRTSTHGKESKSRQLLTILEGRAGEDLHLSCEPDVDPTPPLLFQWRVAGRIIEPQNIENPARLIIPLTRELNGVVIECSVSQNPDEAPLTTFVTISVTFPPYIRTRVSPKRTLTEGENVTLNCEAEANPAVSLISWKRESTGDIIASKNGQLVLTEVDRKDGRRYVCQATNSEGLAEAVEQLSVNFPPSSAVVSPTSNVVAKYGQDLVLTCDADGLPPPSYVWLQLKNGKEMLRGNSSSMTFTSISYADSGQWRCRASNKEGNWTSKPTELQVFGPPSSLSAPGKVVGRVGEKLEITASFCCHPAARVDWVVGHTTLVNKEDIGRITFTTKDEQDSCYSSTLTFNRLLVSDSGEVVVEVANSEGGQRRNIIIQVVENLVQKDTKAKVNKLITEGNAWTKANSESKLTMEVTGLVEDGDISSLEEENIGFGEFAGEEELSQGAGEPIVNVKEPQRKIRTTSLWLGSVAALVMITIILRKVNLDNCHNQLMNDNSL